MTARIAVLASGGGTNLQAIFDHFDQLGATRAGDVVLVASNRADAGALVRARERNVTIAVIPASGDTLLTLLQTQAIDLVVLAGYLKLIPPDVTAAYRGRIVNIHPGPLPDFGGAGMYGLRVHRAVLDANARETAVTVHFVDEHYDRGATIVRWPVLVSDDDTPETLATRVLRVEHIVYPRVVDALAAIIAVDVAVDPAADVPVPPVPSAS